MGSRGVEGWREDRDEGNIFCIREGRLKRLEGAVVWNRAFGLTFCLQLILLDELGPRRHGRKGTARSLVAAEEFWPPLGQPFRPYTHLHENARPFSPVASAPDRQWKDVAPTSRSLIFMTTWQATPPSPRVQRHTGWKDPKRRHSGVSLVQGETKTTPAR